VRGEIEQSLADLAQLQSVIASILRIARIESVEIGAMKPFDPRDVLDEMAETFGSVAEDAAQHLIYSRADACKAPRPAGTANARKKAADASCRPNILSPARAEGTSRACSSHRVAGSPDVWGVSRPATPPVLAKTGVRPVGRPASRGPP
jgi:hypothetical protein